ncbi:unnamed protein product [Pleuronectes platessa]|uniref:Uncharacterized protein n=1 Tax=Pleuronectes platessa TaxID=8262 RepID=A0A9N7W433_PLEPL|nr:unnamed protein product [Pleuronectes platessa]
MDESSIRVHISTLDILWQMSELEAPDFQLTFLPDGPPRKKSAECRKEPVFGNSRRATWLSLTSGGSGGRRRDEVCRHVWNITVTVRSSAVEPESRCLLLPQESNLERRTGISL